MTRSKISLALVLFAVAPLGPVACGGGGGGGGTADTPGAPGGGDGPGDSTPTPSTPAAPAFPGFELALEQGAFWKFAWDHSHSGGAMGSETRTATFVGHLYVRLGAPIAIAGHQAYAVELYGPTKLRDDAVDHAVAPRWRWLAASGSRLLGSTDGTTLQPVYDMQAGSWPGGGFFGSFPANALVKATAGTLSNDHVDAPGVVVERSMDEDKCEYFPEVGTICGDRSQHYVERDYFAPGVGPLGYLYENSYEDCGGGFCSWGTWRQHTGLVASSFRGASFAPLAEAEPNDARAAAQLAASTVIVGDVHASDAAARTSVAIPDATTVSIHDFFAFDHPGGAVEITLSFESAAGADLDLYVFDAAGAQLGYATADNVGSKDPHEQLTGSLPAGRYTVGVSAWSTPSRASYQLQWE